MQAALWVANISEVITVHSFSSSNTSYGRFLLDGCLNSSYCVWLGGEETDTDQCSVRQKQVRV